MLVKMVIVAEEVRVVILVNEVIMVNEISR